MAAVMKILILGATSAIVHETAKLFAAEGTHLVLVARNKEKLSAVASDLRIRGANQVEEYPLDLTRMELHQNLIDTAHVNLQGIDTLLIGYGTLSNQETCQESTSETLKEFNTNCMSIISLLTIMGNYFESRRQGCIAVITSVAGDRGRQSNYVYGAAKGAVTIFLQGLRNRLSRSGVSVITIKPGFVDTPMTAHLPKNALFANPEKVGQKIHHAIRSQKDIVYVPWFWTIVMAGVRLLPERLFKRLSL